MELEKGPFHEDNSSTKDPFLKVPNFVWQSLVASRCSSCPQLLLFLSLFATHPYPQWSRATVKEAQRMLKKREFKYGRWYGEVA